MSLAEQVATATEAFRELPEDHPVWRLSIRSKADIWPPVAEWAVGVTTAPRRQPTLVRCLKSLADAGWPNFHLFIDVDGECTVPRRYMITRRRPAVGAFANWWLALQELFQRNPKATHFLLVQDDAIFCRNVREYVEQLELPGIVSLYRSARHPGRHTCRHTEGEQFTGALALSLSRGAVRRLVTSSLGFEHAKTARPSDNIDGALGRWCQQHDVPLWLHAPSLAQHVGETSTLGHSEQPSTSFVGEEFDAMDLVRSAPKIDRDRTGQIGIVGFNTAQGLGYLNRDLARKLPADRWLITEHSRFPMLALIDQVDNSVVEANADDETLRRWLSGLSAVLFAEAAIAQRLPLLARQAGVRTVCVPMWEGLPTDAPWTHCVDLWLAPTRHTYADLICRGVRGEVAYRPWPIDVSRFPFRLRERVRRYVFAYGNGGHYDRKGGRIVAEASRMAPDVPIIVYDQTATHRTISNLDVDWPSHVDYRGAVDDPADLYREGDVLIAPSRWEGLGLQLLECQAAGMPLITTDAAPMNEQHPWLVLPAEPSLVELSRPVPSWDVWPEDLADFLVYNLGRDIAQESRDARTWAETRDWAACAADIRRLILG